MDTFSERFAHLIGRLKALHLQRAYERQSDPDFRRRATLKRLARHYRRYDDLLNRCDDSRSADELHALEDRLREIEANPTRDPAELIVSIETFIIAPISVERATTERSFFAEADEEIEEAAQPEAAEAADEVAEDDAAEEDDAISLAELSPIAREMVDLLGTQSMLLSNRSEKLRREGADFTQEEYDAHAGPLSLASGLYNARIRSGELDVTAGELDEYKFKRQIALTCGANHFLSSIDRLHDFIQARLVATHSPA